MRLAIGAATLLAALSSVACSVNLSRSEGADIVKNQCTNSSDCGDGACWGGGTCVAYQGALASLLFELIPPDTFPTPGIGGARFLQFENDLSRSNEQHDLNLAIASTVFGYVNSDCPFEATLTPEQDSYGLSAASYVVRTTPAVVGRQNVDCPQAKAGGAQELAVNLPKGRYDVYLRPISTAAAGAEDGAPACDAVPAAFLLEAPEGISCLTLGVPAPQTLDVQIPGPPTAPALDGWKVDILHPLTGKVLSRPTTLGSKDIEVGIGYRRTIKYSPVGTVDTMNTRQELLRLSPPSPADGPVIQLSLGPLLTPPPRGSSGMQVIVPPMGPFPKKVHVEGAVLDALDFDAKKETPIPSTLTFTATELDTLANGVFASYSTTVLVGNTGRISVDLLPGKYRVRVTPNIDPLSDRHLAAQEATWSVRASDGEGGPQAGRVIGLMRAASIIGRAVSPLGGGIDGATVQAHPGSTGMLRCDGEDPASCASQPLDVLGMALAEDEFVPRTAAGVTDGRGQFTLLDVDCGGCTPSTGALFDVAVQPADGSRLPWVIRTGVAVSSTDRQDLKDVRATLPIVQRGKVQVPVKSEEAILVPATLIRAYVLRDATGEPIYDPSGIPSCTTGAYSGTESNPRCIRSALQVAETRADAQGNYELVLPAAIDAAAR